jgi:hypothetical protein
MTKIPNKSLIIYKILIESELWEMENVKVLSNKMSNNAEKKCTASVHIVEHLRTILHLLRA